MTWIKSELLRYVNDSARDNQDPIWSSIIGSDGFGSVVKEKMTQKLADEDFFNLSLYLINFYVSSRKSGLKRSLMTLSSFDHRILWIFIPENEFGPKDF